MLCALSRLLSRLETNIVFVWSQYDGGNIEQRTIGYGCRQNQEAKLKIVGEQYLERDLKSVIKLNKRKIFWM